MARMLMLRAAKLLRHYRCRGTLEAFGVMYSVYPRARTQTAANVRRKLNRWGSTFRVEGLGFSLAKEADSRRASLASSFH